MLHQALMIAQESPVVYVAAEGSSGYRNRVEAWCEYHQKEVGNLWFIFEEVNLLKEEHIQSLITFLAPKKPVLIVFDTYARCLVGGDENSAKDAGIAIHHCGAVQSALAAAVVLVHHTDKAGRAERGSSSLRGAADSMMEMGVTDDGIRVECSKPPKDDIAWLPEIYEFHTVAKSGVLRPPASLNTAVYTPLALSVLEFVSLSVFEDVGAHSRQIQQALNLKVRTMFRVLSSLKKHSAMAQGRNGDPYKITEIGRAALDFSRGVPEAKLFPDIDDEVIVQ
jgi:AAA domain